MDLRDCRRLFGHVVDRLIAAGWLESIAFTRHMGYELNWTLKGAERAVLLRDLIERYRLDRSETAVGLFTAACRDEPATGAGSRPIEAAARYFWLQCLDELPLEEHGDDLLGLVHASLCWRPRREAVMA